MARPLGHRPQLDGLRTVAVAVVVAIHTIEALSPSLAGHVLPGGFLGVDLFFVLSGFLITRLLLDELELRGRVRFGGFYVRRALRLLPAVAVLLAAHVAWAVATGVSLRVEAESVGAVVGYVSNIAFARDFVPSPGLAHLWSLAVEEQFYLVWPVALLVLSRRVDRRALARLLVVAMAVSTVACGLAWARDPSWRHIYVRTDLRATPLLAGALLAVLWPVLSRRARTLGLAARAGWAAFAVLVLVAHIDDGWVYAVGFTATAAAATAMIAGAVAEVGPFGAALTSRPVQWVGRRSYGLYLWHYPVIVAVAQADLGLGAVGEVALALALGLAATALSYRVVEAPFLRLKARYAPSAPRDVPERVLGPAVVLDYGRRGAAEPSPQG